MNARLVEHWLDSASERSYQAAFCQILLAKGYRVLHSTRHGSIELGKDVVAVAPDGVPWAFQLKGNPGARLTLNQFREIQPQLHELAVYPLSGPGYPAGPHRAALVTNGWVEEEVRLAIERANTAYQAQGLTARVEVIQRGDLLADAIQLGESLWPSDQRDIHALLEILVADGRSMYPWKHAHRLLSELFQIEKSEGARLTDAELQRRVTSASILMAVSLTPFVERDNHYAAVTAWTMFVNYAIAATERCSGDSIRTQQAIIIAEKSILSSLGALANEVIARKTLTEGDQLIDSVCHDARYLLLLGLLSVFWLWHRDRDWPDNVDKGAVESFLLNRRYPLDIWGEAAVPQALAYYWFLRATSASSDVEGFLIELIARITASVEGRGEGLAAPYFDFNDVAGHRHADILGQRRDSLAHEAIGSSSYVLESLLHLLARTNRKQACRSVWPAASKMTFSSFVPADSAAYCLWRTDDGQHQDAVPALTKTWSQLLSEARRVDCRGVPQEMLERPCLHLLFLILCPYRATPASLRHLGYKLDDTWLVGEPLIGDQADDDVAH